MNTHFSRMHVHQLFWRSAAFTMTTAGEFSCHTCCFSQTAFMRRHEPVVGAIRCQDEWHQLMAHDQAGHEAFLGAIRLNSTKARGLIDHASVYISLYQQMHTWKGPGHQGSADIVSTSTKARPEFHFYFCRNISYLIFKYFRSCLVS